MSNRNLDIETTPSEVISIFLSGALGAIALGIGILAAVTDSSLLAIVAGIIALLLAGLAGWLLQSRRALVERLQSSNADVIRLEAALGEQVKNRVESEGASGTAKPTPATDAEKTEHVSRSADAIGLDRLSGKVANADDSSGLTDARTGLLGEQYFRVTLDGRVASARRHLRPLALILLDVISGEAFDQPDHADPVKVAEIAQSTLRDADTLCRLDDGRFAMILEDTPENGAIWTVERIRRRINEELEGTTAWAGVACYPAHGFDGAEVLAQAVKAITAARDWRQDRTEVADS